MSNTYKGTITLASVDDATQLYTWIRYSNGQPGTEHYVTPQPFTDTKQIGFAYNQPSSTPSSDYSAYTWSDYIGADGVGIDSIVEQYYLSTDAVNPPAEDASGWSNTPQTWQSGKYYWTRSEITWTDNTTTHTTAVLAVDINQINQNLVNLQSQVDGQIQTWYYEGTPTLNNAPANTWTTTIDKDKHIGDLYYDKSTGYAYRFMYDNTTSAYVWTKITDSDVTEALQLAESKSTVWVIQPTVPYYAGDLWVVTNQDGSKTIYSCTQDRTTGSFTQGDWIVTATDDTIANAAVAAATAITETAITNVDVYYAKNTNATVPPSGYTTYPPTGDWSTTAPTWEDGKYIWSITYTTQNSVTTGSSPVNITGATGSHGINTATVNLYKRGDTAPAKPTGTAQYTFSTQTIDTTNLNGWSQTVPTTGTGTLWLIAATATSDTDTDNIASTEWSAQIQLEGTNGSAGANGYNQATLYIYRRSSTALSTPSSVTYTFADGSFTVPTNWSKTIPSGTDPCYVCSGVAISQSATATVNWSTPAKLVEDGAPGAPGATGNGIATTTIQYAIGDDGDTTPSSGWQSTIPSVPNGKYLWTWTRFTYTDSTTKDVYSVARFGEDGDPGLSGELYRVETNHDFIYTVNHDHDRDYSAIEDIFSPINIEFEVYRGGTVVSPGQGTSSNYQDTDGYVYLGTNESEQPLTPGVGYWYDFFYLGPGTSDIASSLPILLDPADLTNISTVSGNTVIFHMSGLQSGINISDNYRIIYDTCLDGNAFFAFVVYSDSTKQSTLTRYVFYTQNLLTSSLASFETTATAIKMAVDQGALRFDADGLSIYNGDLTIYSTPINADPATRVLYFDTSKGKLHIEGDGSFSGTIYATNGEFTGTIHATNGDFNGTINALDGTIGGFTITDHSLISTDTNENIQLYGATGSIYARNITLGEFASIEKYIQVGSGDYISYIYNPDYAVEYDNGHLPYFFKVNNNVYLTATGVLNLNRIVLDGITSTIKGTGVEQDPNFGWPDFYITPEKAYFRNVDISGKISSAIFEADHTQAVGGAMLFKPSYKINQHRISGENVILVLEEDPSVYLQANTQYVLIIDKNGGSIIQTQVNTISKYIISYNEEAELVSFQEDVVYYELDNDEYIITEDITPVEGKIYYTENDSVFEVTVVDDDNHILSNSSPITLIILGENNDIIIGINSTNNTQDYMRPRGITISEFNANSNTLPVPKVYLGDLSKAGFNITGISADTYSYGLYSNNVILNGSLTTQIASEYLYKQVIPTPTAFENGIIYLEKVEDQYVPTSDESPDPNKTYYIYTYTYAGVNTLSQVSANIFDNYFDDPDTTKIVYWAGSQGVSGTQIQASPFQVTEKGSIYAKNGLFTGAIIAKSTIKGVDIYAARIHGAAQDQQLMEDNIISEYGLAFYNAAQGIVFKTGGDDDDTATTVFSIGSNGLYTSTTNFINIANSTVDFNGDDFNGNNFTATNLIQGLQLKSLKDNLSITIGGSSTPNKIIYTGSKTSYINFYNSNGEISFSNGNSIEQFTLNVNSANFTVDELHSTTNFQLGTTPGAGYMRYKKVSNGYDLYI